MTDAPATVTRTISLEVAKPLNCSWDELRVLLRTQRCIIPQLLRSGMDALIACGVVETKAVHGHVCPDARGTSPATVVYQSMKAELDRIQHGKWRDAARPALNLPAGMLSALARRVTQTYKLRPSFKGHQPIPVRRAELHVEADGDAVVVRVLLMGGGTGPRGGHRLLVRASEGFHWSIARRLAKGELAYGAGSLVFSERKDKWFVRIAYEAPVRVVQGADPSVALVVRRGVHTALMLMGTDGSYRRVPGEKVNAQLHALEARMRAARQIGADELGRGARGHGKRRRYAHYDALHGKRRRVVRTWCQQMGAAVVRQATRIGAGKVVIENFGGFAPDKSVAFIGSRFPFYQLKQSILEACEKRAIAVDEVAADYVSTTCPSCSVADARSHNRRTGTFHCLACGLSRPADFVAALNMLRRADVDSSTWDERMDQYKRLVESLKEQAAE